MARRKRRRGITPGGELSFFSFQDIITSVTGILLLITLIMAATLVPKSDAEPTAAAAPPVLAYVDSETDQAASQQKVRADSARADQVRAEAEVLSRGLIVVSDMIALLPSVNQPALDELATAIPVIHAQAKPLINAAQQQSDQVKGEMDAVKAAIEALNQELATANTAMQTPAGLAFIVGTQSRKPILVELDAYEVAIGDLDADGRPRLIAKDNAWEWRDLMNDNLKSMARDEISIVILTHPDGVSLVGDIQSMLMDRGFRVGWDVAPARRVFESAAPDGKGDTDGQRP